MKFCATSVGGIADRVADLLLCRKLAHVDKADLHYFWWLNNGCNCKFEKVFRLIDPSITISNIADPKFTDLKPPTSLDLIRRELRTGKLVCIHGHQKEYSDFSEVLGPSATVSKLVNAFLPKLGTNSIGVHIRTTDKVREGIKVNLEEWYRMTSVEAGAHARIFLATDDGGPKYLGRPNGPRIHLGVREFMETKFPGRVFTYPVRSIVRATEEAIIDAVVVLFLLAHTRSLVVKEKTSGYSKFAKQLWNDHHGIPMM